MALRPRLGDLLLQCWSVSFRPRLAWLVASDLVSVGVVSAVAVSVVDVWVEDRIETPQLKSSTYREADRTERIKERVNLAPIPR